MSIYLAFDNDEAGRKGMSRIIEKTGGSTKLNGYPVLRDCLKGTLDESDFGYLMYELENLFYKENKGINFMTEIIKTCQTKRDFTEIFNACNTEEQRRKVHIHQSIMFGDGDDIDVREKLSELDIKEYIEAVWGVKMYRNSCACKLPGHKDNTPSFHVYPHTHSFYCFGCGKGGSLIDFLMHNNKMDKKTAIKTILNF